MMCWGRKLKRDQATQTDISYVHWMRLIEYDQAKNVGYKVDQREPRKGDERSAVGKKQ